jgi:hypothetical protein
MIVIDIPFCTSCPTVVINGIAVFTSKNGFLSLRVSLKIVVLVKAEPEQRKIMELEGNTSEYGVHPRNVESAVGMRRSNA